MSGGSGAGGGGGGANEKYDPLKISSNSWETGSKKGSYRLWVKADKNHSKVLLRFAWIAEDGSKDYIVPNSVKDIEDRELKISKDGLVGPIKIEGKIPNLFNVNTGSHQGYGLAVGAFLVK